VFVNGQRVVADGQVLTLNEADILAEFRDRLPEYRRLREGFHRQGARLRPAMDKVYQRAMAHPLAIDNFSRAGLSRRTLAPGAAEVSSVF
jgi:hypothetical protein